MASVVEARDGRLQGEEQGGLHVFRGIPYARPPVGALRFRPPKPAGPWTGVRDATRFGPASLQAPSPMGNMFGREQFETSEDCLYLNVWTPGLDGARRPVMLWIHGGAFVTGSGSTPWYDGTSFATRGDVVVVTINYRLGALGFLYLTEVAGEPFTGSGVLGILDQAAALAWVRDNIAAFGGDPNNVTIFGESAGAMSIGTLLALPAARGLFHRAIPQSGAAHNTTTRERANAITGQMLDALGIERSNASRVMEVPAQQILDAQTRIAMNANGGMAFQPVVDGVTLPVRPIEAITNGSAADVSLLTGTNLDEWQLFTMLNPAGSANDEAGLRRLSAGVFGSEERAETALAAYRSARPEAAHGDIWSAVMTDQVFRVPAARLAEAQSRRQPQTWMYLFAWKSRAFGGRLGSCHALEIPFVFNTLADPGAKTFAGEITPDEEALARTMQDGWIAFARTGDPNHPGLPEWEPYEPERRTTMVFDTASMPRANPSGDELCAWDGLLT